LLALPEAKRSSVLSILRTRAQCFPGCRFLPWGPHLSRILLASREALQYGLLTDANLRGIRARMQPGCPAARCWSALAFVEAIGYRFRRRGLPSSGGRKRWRCWHPPSGVLPLPLPLPLPCALFPRVAQAALPGAAGRDASEATSRVVEGPRGTKLGRGPVR
jgi:hypothetical protein